MKFVRQRIGQNSEILVFGFSNKRTNQLTYVAYSVKQITVVHFPYSYTKVKNCKYLSINSRKHEYC